MRVPKTRKPFDFGPWIQDEVSEDTGLPVKWCGWCHKEGEKAHTIEHEEDCPIGHIEAMEWAMHCLIGKAGYKLPNFPDKTFCGGCGCSLYEDKHGVTCARKDAEDFIGDRFK